MRKLTLILFITEHFPAGESCKKDDITRRPPPPPPPTVVNKPPVANAGRDTTIALPLYSVLLFFQQRRRPDFRYFSEFKISRGFQLRRM